ncbi:FluC/FEX family fluoride channel KNAG_0H01430 [Huiozyma naganishii CBS 8797]|uniref:Fluoride export protein 1 n=1 Tax=Huiozyma naganishii (strain ATCC MYA-139 / BCRC 22969 / CBS 8797 / KCTC 17520 / NBRC 10181 / NCYC 3082 / Yp74L-3) TaxID=1071383 RepID=J7S9K9_HUIN7|nr:hypothetical protein KNAG_0H01430 [Kazachstania naganishii CBS 8797]CCK71556.1 hypothetical protein KNAG_0H01430 [Kazachstania naganishii CBS 8797]
MNKQASDGTSTDDLERTGGQGQNSVQRAVHNDAAMATSLWKKWMTRDSKVHFLLVFSTGSILGTYVRVGIEALTKYKYSFTAEGSSLWPNFVACLLMGALQILNGPENSWFTECPYLYTGLTTGFCGACSSYSSMVLEMMHYSTSLNRININEHVKLPNRAYGIMEFLSVLLSHLFISFGAYIWGRALAEQLAAAVTTSRDSEKSEDSSDTPHPTPVVAHHTVLKYVKWLNMVFAAATIPLIALLIVLACVYNNYSRAVWTLPPLFGIFGSLLRHHLSLSFNSGNVRFPHGTFIANQLGVILICVFDMVQRGKKNGHSNTPIITSVTACRVVSALSNGFCGCLSTLSTFMNEGYRLGFRGSLFYYSVSFGVSYIVCIIMLGSLAWSRGLTVPVC